MTRSLAVYQLFVNNDLQKIVPNSGELDTGKPEYSVMPQLNGENIISEDIETKKAIFNIKMYTTTDQLKNLQEQKNNPENLLLKIIFEDGTTSIINNATITNKLNFQLQKDGTVDVTYEGEVAEIL